jgi:hypothetical protein
LNEAGIPFVILAAALLLVLMMLGAMGVRRYQLRRALGTFDASISSASGRWTMGVCRYADKELEFLRLFSVSPIPQQRYLRSSLELKGWREPDEDEVGRVQPGSVVVMLDYRGDEVLIAMDYGAYTGLSTWLEAGPVIGIGTWR